MSSPSDVLGALGVVAGAPPQTRLVTPYQDVTAAFLAFLGLAHHSIHSMIYSATFVPYFDALIAAKHAGIEVRLIFDHTQAAGRAERAQITRLITAGFVDGVDFLIGTSPRAHQICHIKATWVDGIHVEDGSLNYSPSGLQQVQSVAFTEWPEWAAYLERVFGLLWHWILQHERAYQTFAPPTPASP